MLTIALKAKISKSCLKVKIWLSPIILRPAFPIHLIKKKNPPLRRTIFQIFEHKTPNREETAQNKENAF
jgi:hypothetical protein